MKRFPFFILLLLLLARAAVSHGLEFRVTLSGKLLLGLAYRHQIDPNTAIRLGSYVGISGAPVGFHVGMVQDLTPSKSWRPFFEIGADMLLVNSREKIARRIYPSGSLGLAYCPQPHLKHSGELWLGWLSRQVRPMGLSYVHFNSVY